MKKCSDCGEEKSLEGFPFDKSRGRYLSVCRKCSAKRTKTYRSKNKGKWLEQQQRHRARREAIIAEFRSYGCSRCGEKREYLIEAHHVDPSKKDFSVGTATRGWRVTKGELEKCIPLCSNCHKEFHYFERKNNTTIEKYLNEKD